MRIEEISLNEYKIGIINSIPQKYKSLRQASKTVTFAAQYQGTYRTFMSSSGFSEKEAKSIEANYHNLYKTSKLWLDKLILDATKNGYITGAFGLRVRTPILKQVLWGSGKVPYEATAESRTAGNAAQQGWGLLNNRAQNEFLATVEASAHRLDIQPVASIHDALYFIVKNDPNVVKFVNDNLIGSMSWQDHPDITHDKVKLGAELAIHYPTWANEISVPNKATLEEIRAILPSAVF